MPIYEFYCGRCHAVFNFLSRTINTAKRPDCPRCGRPQLERLVSRVAISKGRKEAPKQADDLPDVDDEKLERAMAELAAESEGADEDDPRQMARMMRKLQQTAGLPLGRNVEEALRRLEAGEYPDKIEEEMGDLFDDESPLAGEEESGGLKGLVRRLKPPAVDETLYDL